MEEKFLKIFEQKSEIEILQYITELFTAYKKTKNRDQSLKNLDEMKKYFIFDEMKGIPSAQLEKQIQLFVSYLERNQFLIHFEFIIEEKQNVEGTFNQENIRQFLEENNQDLALIDQVLNAINENNFSKDRIKKQIKKILPGELYQKFNDLIKAEQMNKKQVKKQKIFNKKSLQKKKEINQEYLDDSDSLLEYKNKNDDDISLSPFSSQLSSKMEDSNNSCISKSQDTKKPLIKKAQSVNNLYPKNQHDQSLQGKNNNNNNNNNISSYSSIYLSNDSVNQENNQSNSNTKQIILNIKNAYQQPQYQKEFDLSEEQPILIDKEQNQSCQLITVNQSSLQQSHYKLLEEQINPVLKKKKFTQDSHFECKESQETYQSQFLSQDNFSGNKEKEQNYINDFQLQNLDKEELEDKSESSIEHLQDENYNLSSDSSSNNLSEQTLLDIDKQLDNQLMQINPNKETIKINFQKMTEIKQMLIQTNQQKQDHYNKTSQLIQSANNFFQQSIQKDLIQNIQIKQQNFNQQPILQQDEKQFCKQQNCKEYDQSNQNICSSSSYQDYLNFQDKNSSILIQIKNGANRLQKEQKNTTQEVLKPGSCQSAISVANDKITNIPKMVGNNNMINSNDQARINQQMSKKNKNQIVQNQNCNIQSQELESSQFNATINQISQFQQQNNLKDCSKLNANFEKQICANLNKQHQNYLKQDEILENKYFQDKKPNFQEKEQSISYSLDIETDQQLSESDFNQNFTNSSQQANQKQDFTQIKEQYSNSNDIETLLKADPTQITHQQLVLILEQNSKKSILRDEGLNSIKIINESLKNIKNKSLIKTQQVTLAKSFNQYDFRQN
ncbi:hypothetical protein ABPG72_004675 [Tetrahymena utriculariae]